MTEAKEPMTEYGNEMLKKELKQLISIDRIEVIGEIEVAREHGDLSENAEYDAAKERQGMIEAKIQQIQDKLIRSVVIDPSKISTDKVAFGATVLLYDVGTEKSKQYKIVGEDEADIAQGLLSIHSPLARALIGKKEDDEIAFKAPGGLREYVIENLEYK
jgi:transcription elongation factor GreA